MTKLAYLQQYPFLLKSIEAKTEQLKVLEDLNYKTSGIYDNVSGTGAKINYKTSQLENHVMTLIDLQERIKEEINRLSETGIAILNAIRSLNDFYSCYVLEERFINGKEYEEIAENLGYYSVEYMKKNVKRIIAEELVITLPTGEILR